MSWKRFLFIDGAVLCRSPGFGMTLWAETKTGVVYSAEVVSAPKGTSDEVSAPDELGRRCATSLLREIARVSEISRLISGLISR